MGSSGPKDPEDPLPVVKRGTMLILIVFVFVHKCLRFFFSFMPVLSCPHYGVIPSRQHECGLLPVVSSDTTITPVVSKVSRHPLL